MFEGEADYVRHFWNQKPKQIVGKVRIYLVQSEPSEFPALFGREQVCLQECNNGNIIEVS